MSGARTAIEPRNARRQSSDITTVRSISVAQTRALGMTLGKLLAPGDVVLLEGDLGAGKTALTQGIAAGVGVRGAVNSPTFTILKEYTGRLPFYHFDLYRIDSPEEVYDLGFDDYFSGDGVCVVEWAERGELKDNPSVAPWPQSYLRLSLRAIGSHSRSITVRGAGVRGAALREQWMHALAEDA